MSSITRRIPQTPARVKYFLALETYPPPEPEGFAEYTDPTLVFEDGYPGSIIEDGTIPAYYVQLTQGELLKDLGREIVTVNSSGQRTALYREVQRVNGAATGGVGGRVDINDAAYGCFFVKVWSANGENVYVARTG